MLAEHLAWLPQLTATDVFLGLAAQSVWFLIALLCLATMWFSGKNYYVSALKQVRHKRANMDSLVALGTFAAWISSLIIIINPNFIPNAQHLYLDAAVMILAFLQIGHVLEIKAKHTTSEAIASIIEIAPKTAIVIVDDMEIRLPVSYIVQGDIIKVKPGERIPLDGTIISGSSSIDESMLTGESQAINKKINDQVIAGSVNKMGSFTFKVDKLADDTTLAHIITMVKKAQVSKPQIGRLVDKVAGIFVPIVIVIAIITFVTWLTIGPEPQLAYSLSCSIAVLVIACPCALGLATPIAIMMGTSKAAQLAILIKNSDALQTASQISHLVVDKTGTLTQGKASITDIIINPNSLIYPELDENMLLQLASSLEVHSEHPLAESILTEAETRKIPKLKSEQFLAISARGVQGLVNKKMVFVGNRRFMHDKMIHIPNDLQKKFETLSHASTTVWLANPTEVLGFFAVQDPLRSDSRQAIKALQQQGIHLVLCSGDTQQSVKAIADELGITSVYSEVKPADKLKVITDLQQQDFKVGMVGDGINDAPALAQANTGFAIGSGTDVAIENADITLAGNSLMNVSTAIAISKATIKNIKQNLFAAFIYNIIGIPLAAGLFYPMTGWLLAPAFASAAMALSSVTVVTNANRLRFFKSRS